MRLLRDQDELEQLLGVQALPPEAPPLPPMTVIYFTASWCGACKRLDIPSIEASFPMINWLKCDVDANDYSPGYCGVRSIPAFVAIVNKRMVSSLQSSSNERVVSWLSLTGREASAAIAHNSKDSK
jgi:thioredoxin-like negative regulator of GroEL